MSELNTPSDAAQRIESLEKQVTLMLLLLVLATGSLAVYFFRQASDANKEYTQVASVIEAYNKNQTAIKSAVTQLSVYGQTHRDIQPLLEKYNLTGPPPVAPTAPPRH